MKIKNTEINNFIDTLTPYKNPILLYGPDEGLVLYRSKEICKTFFNKNKVQHSIKIFDTKENSLSSLEEAINTNSLFSNKEIIRVINSNEKLSDIFHLFEKLVDVDDVLVILNAGELGTRSKLRKFFEENKNNAIVPCYKTDSLLLRKSIIQFANNNNLEIQEEALSYLMAVLGDNYQIITNELQKLLLLNSNIISYELVRGLISQNGSSAYDDITFNCLLGKKDLLSFGVDQNINDLSSASYLLFNMKQMLLILGKTINQYNSDNLGEIVSANMPKYLFRKKDVFANIIKKNNQYNILKSIKIVSEIELKMRQNQNMYKIFLLRGMLNIAQSMS